MPAPHATDAVGVQRQLEIYMDGMHGQPPRHPIAVEALREEAREALTQEAWDYLDGGAGRENTMAANRAAFERWRIVPRMLRGVAERDLTVELFGQTLRAPILLAPIGVLSILHDEAETAVARAARDLNVPMVLSTAASRTIEEIADALGRIEDDPQAGTPRWFQLYWGKNPDLTASLLERAEKAGYSALVVTLDTTLLSWRERDVQNGYLPFLHGEGLANYFSDPAFRAALDEPPEENPTQAILYFASIFSNPALTWEDLATLRDQTDLPILLKGILHPDDARTAVDHGADGLVVSNHGGRQVDGAIAALDALPRVMDAVGVQRPVLFDSGIRRGSDVVKALALGARAVLVGRPYAYGLAAGGQAGARDAVHNLLADFDLTLGLSGYDAPGLLSPESLVRADASEASAAR